MDQRRREAADIEKKRRKEYLKNICCLFPCCCCCYCRCQKFPKEEDISDTSDIDISWNINFVNDRWKNYSILKCNSIWKNLIDCWKFYYYSSNLLNSTSCTHLLVPWYIYLWRNSIIIKQMDDESITIFSFQFPHCDCKCCPKVTFLVAIVTLLLCIHNNYLNVIL